MIFRLRLSISIIIYQFSTSLKFSPAIPFLFLSLIINKNTIIFRFKLSISIIIDQFSTFSKFSPAIPSSMRRLSFHTSDAYARRRKYLQDRVVFRSEFCTGVSFACFTRISQFCSEIPSTAACVRTKVLALFPVLFK